LADIVPPVFAESTLPQYKIRVQAIATNKNLNSAEWIGPPLVLGIGYMAVGRDLRVG
jgi:hypothetical protein